MKIISMLSIVLLFLTGCNEEQIYKSVMDTRVKQAHLTKKSTTISNNLTVEYYENRVNSDKTLVMLHGFGADKDNWLQLAVALGNKYHLIIPDFVGYGESSKPSGIDYSLEKQSDRLHEFLSKIKANNVTLVGNSMGGGISIKYAEKYPVETLVLISSMGPKGDKSYFDLLSYAEKAELLYGVDNTNKMYKLLDILMESRPLGTSLVINYLTQKRRDANDMIREQSPVIVDNELVVRNNIFQTSLNVTVPTLIIWGKEDKMLDVTSAQLLKEAIPDSTLKVYNNVGHVAMEERPYMVAWDMKSFLD